MISWISQGNGGLHITVSVQSHPGLTERLAAELLSELNGQQIAVMEFEIEFLDDLFTPRKCLVPLGGDQSVLVHAGDAR